MPGPSVGAARGWTGRGTDVLFPGAHEETLRKVIAVTVGSRAIHAHRGFHDPDAIGAATHARFAHRAGNPQFARRRLVKLSSASPSP